MPKSSLSSSSSGSSIRYRPRKYAPSSIYAPRNVYPSISSPDIRNMSQKVLISMPSSRCSSEKNEASIPPEILQKQTNVVTLMQWPKDCDCTLYKIEDLADVDNEFLQHVIEQASKYCQSDNTAARTRQDLSNLVYAANDMISSHWDQQYQAGALKPDEKKVVLTILPNDECATLQNFKDAPGHTRVNLYCPYANRVRGVEYCLRKGLRETILENQRFEGSPPSSDEQENGQEGVGQEREPKQPDLARGWPIAGGRYRRSNSLPSTSHSMSHIANDSLPNTETWTKRTHTISTFKT